MFGFMWWHKRLITNILLHPLHPWQAPFLSRDSDNFWVSYSTFHIKGCPLLSGSVPGSSFTCHTHPWVMHPFGTVMYYNPFHVKAVLSWVGQWLGPVSPATHTWVMHPFGSVCITTLFMWRVSSPEWVSAWVQFHLLPTPGWCTLRSRGNFLHLQEQI